MRNNKQKDAVNQSRRTWIAVSCVAGGAGTVAAAVPFVASFGPSDKAKAAGAPVEVDISTLQPGEKMTVAWRGKPVWIVRRTPAELADLPQLDDKLADPFSERAGYTPVYAQNVDRAIKSEYLVVVGICTHLGCAPNDKFQAGGDDPALPSDWKGGFLCPCHGSLFDLSGRVYKDMPAPDNLEVPPYRYLSASKILIGEDQTA